MTYAGFPYGGVGYAGSDVAQIPTTNTTTILAVEWSPTTGALDTPVWVDITADVRSWNTSRGRNRELERFQPGRATIVLSNLDRQYDSVYAAGPNYGNIRPMRRIRIRETFNGVTYPVFDGFVDKWKLDYPNVGRDATATVTATDAMKVLARSDLPRSVYAYEVNLDAPLIWWRLNEDVARLRDGFVLNGGTGGTADNATFVGSPKVAQDVIVVNDPGSSLGVTDNFSSPGTPIQGAELANATFSLLSQTTFSVEAWVRLAEAGTTQRIVWCVSRSADAAIHGICGYFDTTGSGAAGRFQFLVQNSAFALFYGVETPAGSVLPGQIHHVVCVVESDGQMALWLNGTRYTTLIAGATATSLSGVTRPTNGDFQVGFERDSTPNPDRNWGGEISNFAVWPSQLGADRIAAHYAAGTAPWKNDLPGARLGRILDIGRWPAALREIDAGITTLQSAALEGQSVLDHAQKVGETEFGLWFVTRDGTVRFVGRTGLFAREPAPAVYGDQAAQVGYRNFVPDDGDEVIRNRAIISRLNGVAQTASDAASITAYGPFEYTLEGLLHQSDSYSLDYGNLIVDEYGIQQRRIASLTVGPPISGQESIVYPAMLGPELGDAITVTNTPVGGGSAFTQVCGVEGIQASGAPGGVRTTTFTLSPEFAIRTLEDQDVATLGYAQVTANQGSITGEVDLTSLSVPVTVGTSRRVRISGEMLMQNTGAGNVSAFRIKEGATQLQSCEYNHTTANVPATLAGSVVVTPTPGSHTYKLAGLCSAGTTTMVAGATLPAFILVEDIGPA